MYIGERGLYGVGQRDVGEEGGIYICVWGDLYKSKST